jgi:pilus assembly protein CpaF
MVLMADVALPLHAIRRQIASSIDLVVQVRRFPDGTRSVSDVVELQLSHDELLTVSLLESGGSVREFSRPSRYMDVAP